MDLIGVIDSDWVGDGNYRKSTLGFLFMIGSGPICWSNKKQATLAISLAKAEYRGVVNASIQEFWLHGIMTYFGIHTSPLVDLYCDNHSTIKISEYHKPL